MRWAGQVGFRGLNWVWLNYILTVDDRNDSMVSPYIRYLVITKLVKLIPQCVLKYSEGN